MEKMALSRLLSIQRDQITAAMDAHFAELRAEVTKLREEIAKLTKKTRTTNDKEG